MKSTKFKPLLFLIFIIIVSIFINFIFLSSIFPKSTSDVQSNKPSNILSKSVKIKVDDNIEEVSLKEYLMGVLAAEMPLSFEEEALKAQVVAAHSFALKRYGEDGVYLTNPNVFQAYVSKAGREKKFKSKFDQNERKLEYIVSQVADTIITYEDQPIVAVFHSMSAGKTRNGADVWGGNYPYLTKADSHDETSLEKFLTETEISKQDVESTLKEKFPSIQLPQNPKDWFEIISKKDSDYIETIRVGNENISGDKLRSIFSLRSSSLDINYTPQDTFIFKCKGHGHGVGMSQYGANELAKKGKTYEEILKHYYKDTTLKKI